MLRTDVERFHQELGGRAILQEARGKEPPDWELLRFVSKHDFTPRRLEDDARVALVARVRAEQETLRPEQAEHARHGLRELLVARRGDHRLCEPRELGVDALRRELP